MFSSLGIDSYAWMLIILIFGGLGLFLDKFIRGGFYIGISIGLIVAFIAVNLLK